MADANSSTTPRAPDFSPFLVDTTPVCFVLVQDSYLELLAILSAYSDLAELMDLALPEYTFLEMLNVRFARFVRELPSSVT